MILNPVAAGGFSGANPVMAPPLRLSRHTVTNVGNQQLRPSHWPSQTVTNPVTKTFPAGFPHELAQPGIAKVN